MLEPNEMFLKPTLQVFFDSPHFNIIPNDEYLINIPDEAYNQPLETDKYFKLNLEDKRHKLPELPYFFGVKKYYFEKFKKDMEEWIDIKLSDDQVHNMIFAKNFIWCEYWHLYSFMKNQMKVNEKLQKKYKDDKDNIRSFKRTNDDIKNRSIYLAYKDSINKLEEEMPNINYSDNNDFAFLEKIYEKSIKERNKLVEKINNIIQNKKNNNFVLKLCYKKNKNNKTLSINNSYISIYKIITEIKNYISNNINKSIIVKENMTFNIATAINNLVINYSLGKESKDALIGFVLAQLGLFKTNIQFSKTTTSDNLSYKKYLAKRVRQILNKKVS